MSGNAAAERYSYQGSFVEETLKGAQYDIFFGAFGTGILGVKKLLENKTISPDPADHYIMLFINVRGSGLSMIQTSTITTFHNDSFDKDGKALRWSSQYSDRDSKRAELIINHCASGSPVIVAVRRNAAGSFSLLGRAKELIMHKEAHLLLSVGDHMLEVVDNENSASDKLHKAISASCMILPRTGLIRTVKATEEILTGRKICLRCCCMPAAVDIIFDEMNPDGLEMFEEEAEEKAKKLVKKKPVKADKPMTRVSAKVVKAQKKAELAAKRAKKGIKSENPSPSALMRDNTLAEGMDGMGDDLALGKLVTDGSSSSGAASKGDQDRRFAQAERLRVAEYQKKMQSKTKDAVISQSTPKNDGKPVPRRRLRGRTALVPSEIASLPQLPEGMIDILDGMLVKVASPDVSEQDEKLEPSPKKAKIANECDDKANAAGESTVDGKGEKVDGGDGEKEDKSEVNADKTEDENAFPKATENSEAQEGEKILKATEDSSEALKETAEENIAEDLKATEDKTETNKAVDDKTGPLKEVDSENDAKKVEKGDAKDGDDENDAQKV